GHQAALERFGSAAVLEPCQTHAEVFSMVEKGAADYGLVAFENSTEGPVNEVLDRLVDTSLQICAEVSLPISHTLLSRATSLSTIKRVLCHPQTAGQTRLWLVEHSVAAIEEARVGLRVFCRAGRAHGRAGGAQRIGQSRRAHGVFESARLVAGADRISRNPFCDTPMTPT